MPVNKLPLAVRSVLRSGVIIPSPTQAVAELVLNSLDANASAIALRIDLRIFKIQVIDNGQGIASNDLEAIGDMSVTSKCFSLEDLYHNLKYHGYRGEAVASLCEMSGIVEIVTRPAGKEETFCKVFTHGKAEAVKNVDRRPSCGTTVTITDFMYNMPVRRESIQEAVELESVRSHIEYIALVHPEVSFSVRNDAKAKMILEKHKSSDIFHAFSQLFGESIAETLAPIEFKTEKFLINGFVSKIAHRHNDIQFIYINRQIILKTKLHKVVRALLAKSAILRRNGPWRHKPIPKDIPVERWLSFPSLEKRNKYPAFVINIKCARREYDVCWNSKKTLVFFSDWDGVVSCVNEAIQIFLRRENLVEEEEVPDIPEGGACDLTDKVSSHENNSEVVPLKENEALFDEVETWNMHGAVQSMAARRPNVVKQNGDKTKYETPKPQNCEVKKIGCKGTALPSSHEIHSRNLASTVSTVAPVVKFLGKYETPPETRLKITKGAYQLKSLEEKSKELEENSNALQQFRCSQKPKLNGIEEDCRVILEVCRNASKVNKMEGNSIAHLLETCSNCIEPDAKTGENSCEENQKQSKKTFLLKENQKFHQIPSLAHQEKQGFLTGRTRKLRPVISNKTSHLNGTFDKMAVKKHDKAKTNTVTGLNCGKEVGSSSDEEMNIEDTAQHPENLLPNSTVLIKQRHPRSSNTLQQFQLSHKPKLSRARPVQVSAVCSETVPNERYEDNRKLGTSAFGKSSESVSLDFNKPDTFRDTFLKEFSKNMDEKLGCVVNDVQISPEIICSSSSDDKEDEFFTYIQSQNEGMKRNKECSVQMTVFSPPFSSPQEKEYLEEFSSASPLETFPLKGKLISTLESSSNGTRNVFEAFSAASSGGKKVLDFSEITVLSIPSSENNDAICAAEFRKKQESSKTNVFSFSYQEKNKEKNWYGNSARQFSSLPGVEQSPYFTCERRKECSRPNITFQGAEKEDTLIVSLARKVSANKSFEMASDQSPVFISGTSHEVQAERSPEGPMERSPEIRVERSLQLHDERSPYFPQNPAGNSVSKYASSSGSRIETNISFEKIFAGTTSSNVNLSPYFSKGKTGDSCSQRNVSKKNEGLELTFEPFMSCGPSPARFCRDTEENHLFDNTAYSLQTFEPFQPILDDAVRDARSNSPVELESAFEETCGEEQSPEQFSAVISNESPGISSTRPFLFDREKSIQKRRRLSSNSVSIMEKSGEVFSCSPSKSVQHSNIINEVLGNSNATEDNNLCSERKDSSEHEMVVDTDTPLQESRWIQLRDPLGKTFYLDKKTGHTSYNPPSMENKTSFYSMTRRSEFIPKGMSPVLTAVSLRDFNGVGPSKSRSTLQNEISEELPENKDELSSVKWRKKPDLSASGSGIENMLNIVKTAESKNSHPSMQIPDVSFFSAKMSSLLFQQKFDKKIFSNLKVIGQLDNKFIVTLFSPIKDSHPHVLGMFDQHAVHERIRLELLMKKYSKKENDWCFETTDVTEPLILRVSSKEYNILGSFEKNFQRLGLHFVLKEGNIVEVSKIPTCLHARDVRERMNKNDQWLNNILLLVIQDQVQFIITTRGQDPVIPEIYRDVINSEACKGAVKFGDTLTINECKRLLSALRKCNLPFFCAHGRPSFIPIFDMRQYEDEIKKYTPQR